MATLRTLLTTEQQRFAAKDAKPWELAADDPALDYPRIDDGVRGMAFIDAVLKSSAKNAKWTPLNI